jgi:membrane protein YdbS with pleckstrin-like domain
MNCEEKVRRLQTCIDIALAWIGIQTCAMYVTVVRIAPILSPFVIIVNGLFIWLMFVLTDFHKCRVVCEEDCGEAR